MKPKTKVLVYSIVFGLIFYLLDSILDASMVYHDMNFFQVFLTNPPYQELYGRLIGIAFIIILGMIFQTFIKEPEQAEITLHKEKRISSDPYLMVNISNQIKTPLNAIQGFVGLLNDPGINESSKRLYVNHIRTSSNYLLEFINNVTDITMIESGGLYLKENDFRLNKMLTSLYTKYSGVVREKDKTDLGILLKVSNKDENLTIHGDESRLKQVLENLIQNAIAFTDDGTIEFGFNNTDDNKLNFYIKDTGSGFSEERLEMIFNQFNAVIDNRMTPFDMVSLRINISKHLVHLMGGELKAESEVNVGSKFSFQIPIDIGKQGEKGTQSEEDEPEVVVETEEKLQWEGKQILIAEDVESNYIYLQEILKETGISIHWAVNGKKACEMAMSNSNIDVILMDILMPEMDGYEAAKKIKKELPHMPIIAQTAYHLDEKDYEDAMLYFEKYLIKPIWSHDLITELTKHLG